MAIRKGQRQASEATKAARLAFALPGRPKGPVPESMGRSSQPQTRRGSNGSGNKYDSGNIEDPDEAAAFTSVAPSGQGRSPAQLRSSVGRAGASARMHGTVDEDVPPVRGFGDDQEQNQFDDDLDDALARPLPTDEEVDEPAVLGAGLGAGRARMPQGDEPAVRTPRPHMPPPIFHRAAQPADPNILQSATLPNLSLRRVAVADIDHLWDWIRTDEDGGQTFLGRQFATSMDLHHFINFVNIEGERVGLSLVRSLYWQDAHFGFLMLAPILAAEKTALCHVYLNQDTRGQLPQLVGHLLALAQQARPGIHLAAYAVDSEWERLYQRLLTPLGFKKHAMFIL